MKQLVMKLIRVSRILDAWRFWNRKKITILMLHGISATKEKGVWNPLWERVTPERLDAVLSQLSKHYNFISLSEAVEMLSGTIPMVNHGLVLTFDDGYRNNVTEAWPVLKRHSAAATFFVAAGFVETGKSFWIDRLDYALQQAPDSARLLRNRQFRFDFRGLSREQLQSQYRNLRLEVKKSAVDDEEMLSVFDAMSGALEIAAGTTISDILDSDESVAIARWDELVQAASEGVTIGSHSVDHRQLARIPQALLDRQLVNSKKMIEEHLQQECRYFCFPNGSFDEAVVASTRDAGYTAALTTVRGLNKVGDNLFTLRRYALPSKPSEFLNLCSISGIFEIPILRNIFRAMS